MIHQLTEEKDLLARENSISKERAEVDSAEMATLKSENKELTETMASRLENIRKLIGRNENLTNTVKVLKVRHDKQRKEAELKYANSLSEKQSEIDVLKQMIKSSNLQLKAREKDQIRLQSKLVQMEGRSLAARQR